MVVVQQKSARLDLVSKILLGDTLVPLGLQSTLHSFTASDVLSSKPTCPFSNIENPWSTLNYMSPIRIPQSGGGQLYAHNNYYS